MPPWTTGPIGNSRRTRVRSLTGPWGSAAGTRTSAARIEVRGTAITPPVLVGAEVTSNGNRINLKFDQSVDTLNLPDVSDFTVTAGGGPVAVGSVIVLTDSATNLSGLALNGLTPKIGQGQAVVVTYTDPSGDDDASAVQNAAGLDALSFTTGQGGVAAVVNSSTFVPPWPVIQSATVQATGDRVDLVFNIDVHNNNSRAPLPSAFTLTVAGSPVSVGNVTVVLGTPIGLRLSSLSLEIRQGQAVTVAYTDPTNGDDTRAIQSQSGDDAPSFSITATNGSIVAASRPSKPRNLSATASGETQIDLEWDPPADNGGRVITGYKIEWSEDGSAPWIALTANTGSTDTTYPTPPSPPGKRGTTASSPSTPKAPPTPPAPPPRQPPTPPRRRSQAAWSHPVAYRSSYSSTRTWTAATCPPVPPSPSPPEAAPSPSAV